MRPFDSREEAYNAGYNDGYIADGMCDAYNDGYNQGAEQGEQQRHELEVEIQELKQKILDLTGECECGCEQYSLCWSSNHNVSRVFQSLSPSYLSKED